MSGTEEGIDPKIFKILKRVRIAEIQAIAIYQAELFFIRRADRREILSRIYREEIEHDGSIQPFVSVGAIESGLNRVVGWILGSFLAALPWKILCRIQSWAEAEAAQIYKAARDEIRERSSKTPSKINAEIEFALGKAFVQEAEHSSYFQSLLS